MICVRVPRGKIPSIDLSNRFFPYSFENEIEEAIAIAAAIETNKSSTIFLSCMYIYIAMFILKKVSFVANQINDEGAKIICAALDKTNVVKKIDMKGKFYSCLN